MTTTVTPTVKPQWTVIKVGTYRNGSCASAFHVQGVLSPREAKAHALAKINSDWCTLNSDYLRNCIELGNYTVEAR